MVSTHYTRTGPLFPFGHFAPERSEHRLCTRIPSHYRSHIWRDSETRPHCVSLLPMVNGPPMAHRSPTMGRMRRNAAAVVVRRHPIYSTFFQSWQVFAALFLENFLLMWENINKYRYFQGKKTFDVVSVFFLFPSFLKCQVCRIKGFAL